MKAFYSNTYINSITKLTHPGYIWYGTPTTTIKSLIPWPPVVLHGGEIYLNWFLYLGELLAVRLEMGDLLYFGRTNG
jgi:hypothetical protein